MKKKIKLNAPTFIYLVVFALLFHGSQAYAKTEKRTLKARTLCLRKADVKPEIFIQGVEKPHQIILPVQTFSGAFDCVLEDGVASFFKKDGTLPNGKPKRTIVAQAKVKANITEALFFFDVAKKDGKDGKDGGKLYNVIVLDDSLQAFPLGQARVLNLFKSDLDITVGEHRKQIKSGDMAVLPAPKRKNASNMTNVLGKIQLQDRKWAAFSEFRSKLTNGLRVFVISHYDTSSGQPKLKMYKDIPMTPDPNHPNDGSQ